MKYNLILFLTIKMYLKKDIYFSFVLHHLPAPPHISTYTLI